MPVRLETSADADDQITVLIDSCRRLPWAAVTRIVVLLKSRDEHPLYSFHIDHVLVPDSENPKQQIAHPDPTTDIRQIVQQVAAHAKKRKKAHTYTFCALGHGTKTVRGKLVIVEDSEIELYRMPISLGEGDIDGDAEEGEVAGMKIVAGVLKDLGFAYKENAADRNSIIDLYRAETSELSKRNRELAEAAAAGATQSVELTRLLIEDRREQRAEAREEAQVRAAMDHEAHMEERRAQRLDAFMTKAMDTPEVGAGIGAVLHAVADFVSSWKRGVAAASGRGDEDEGSSAPVDGLGPRLDAIFSKLNDQGRAAIEAALTQDVWDLVLAASKKTNDTEVRAILAPLQERWNPKDKIVVDPETGRPDAARSKTYSADDRARAHARRNRELNGAAEILGPHMRELMRVLEAAGLVVKD